MIDIWMWYGVLEAIGILTQSQKPEEVPHAGYSERLHLLVLTLNLESSRGVLGFETGTLE